VGDLVQNRNAAPSSLAGGQAGESIDLIAHVDGLIQDATLAVFQIYGVTLHPDTTPFETTLRRIQLLSMIGFSSPSLSGSLLLALPFSVVEHALPAPNASLADWSGELANQVLGRLKNRLLNRVVIHVSLPAVVAGESLQLPASLRQITRYFAFTSEWGNMFIRLDMEVKPGLELTREADPNAAASIGEGELLLF
jgi:chemotaxis phosphatase CheX-like protein